MMFLSVIDKATVDGISETLTSLEKLSTAFVATFAVLVWAIRVFARDLRELFSAPRLARPDHKQHGVKAHGTDMH